MLNTHFGRAFLEVKVRWVLVLFFILQITARASEPPPNPLGYRFAKQVRATFRYRNPQYEWEGPYRGRLYFYVSKLRLPLFSYKIRFASPDPDAPTDWENWSVADYLGKMFFPIWHVELAGQTMRLSEIKFNVVCSRDLGCEICGHSPCIPAMLEPSSPELGKWVWSGSNFEELRPDEVRRMAERTCESRFVDYDASRRFRGSSH
jgi:hypothetical protein